MKFYKVLICVSSGTGKWDNYQLKAESQIQGDLHHIYKYL